MELCSWAPFLNEGVNYYVEGLSRFLRFIFLSFFHLFVSPRYYFYYLTEWEIFFSLHINACK